MTHSATRTAFGLGVLTFVLWQVLAACGGDPTDPPSPPDASAAVTPLGSPASVPTDAGSDAIAVANPDSSPAQGELDAAIDAPPACLCPAPPTCGLDAAPSSTDAAAPPTRLPPWFYGDAGRPVVWIAEGDSMTHPNYTDASDSVYMYPALSSFLLGTAVSVVNIGASGDTLSDMLGQEPFIASHHLVPDGGACVISLLAGTNDLRAYDASVGDVCAWYEAYGEEAHKLGCKFVAMTLPPPDNFIDAAARDQVDECVRHLASADSVVDLAADSELATMTIGDGTHPDKQGHERIAQYVAPAIRDALLDAGARMP